MYKNCCNFLYGIFYIGVIDFALSEHKGLDKSVNLALENVFKLDKHLLHNMQNFIGKIKKILDKKHIERQEQTGTDQIKFTNFILNNVNVLNKFEDKDLKRFFGILNNEIPRYYDKNNNMHILEKNSLVRSMLAYILRRYLKTITNKIKDEAYFEDEKAVIDSVNYINKQDDTTKYDNSINNLIKLMPRNIFLESYYHFKPTANTVLKTILRHYFGSFISLPTKYPVLKQSDNVKKAKLKTKKESRTSRQMYAEKNFNLKYPNDYVPVTKKHKRKYKTRTQKSRVMTMPTKRTTKGIGKGHLKDQKYIKVIEYDINIDTSKNTDNTDEQFNSDDKSTIIKTTKMGDEYYYRRFFYKKYRKQSNQYKTSKQHDEDEKKYVTGHKKINKLSTFYLDLEKLSATNYAQQKFDVSSREYKRSVVRPTGFTTSIKNRKYRNSRQKVPKSKHYGYIQEKRKDVFSNEQQMSMKKKDPAMVRRPPISLNMQLATTKEPSTLDDRIGETTQDVQYIY